MKLDKSLFATLALLASTATIAADEKPRWITEGPTVDDASVSIDVPMQVLANKLFIEVDVGGAPRRFLFDTGSPSMMRADLAAELKLDVVARTKGRDSHGAVVDTDIVQADLTLGGTILRKVPVFVADFPKTAQCLFDGVLGSEVLPLCAWQIDLPAGRLRCHAKLATLDHVEKAEKLALYDFGYPHAPILDIRFTEAARSKALFDTGSPEYLAISPADFDGARRSDGVASTIAGTGSLGGSIGGMAPKKDQLLVRLKTLEIGGMPLGRVDAPLRESSPSLVGASVLDHFVVTLDQRTSSAYFDRYRAGPYLRSSYGLGLSVDDAVSVSLLWNESPAAAAGLRVGQTLKSINGRATETSCEGVRHAMQALSSGDAIALEWDGGAATLHREKVNPE